MSEETAIIEAGKGLEGLVAGGVSEKAHKRLVKSGHVVPAIAAAVRKIGEIL